MRVKRLRQPTPGLLLTPDQVMAELAIGRGTLAKLIEQGRQGDPSGLRTVRLSPQCIRVPRAELEDFIARHLAGFSSKTG